MYTCNVCVYQHWFLLFWSVLWYIEFTIFHPCICSLTFHTYRQMEPTAAFASHPNFGPQLYSYALHNQGQTRRTYVWRWWLIDWVKYGYSFHVHAWLPLYAWLYESALWRTWMLLPSAGRKVAFWLYGFIKCDYFRVLTLWSTKASMHFYEAWKNHKIDSYWRIS